MSYPVAYHTAKYEPRKIEEPDERVVGILQDVEDGTIREVVFELGHFSRLSAELTRIHKLNKTRYVLIGIHSFKLERETD